MTSHGVDAYQARGSLTPSPGMLARLEAAAVREGLTIDTVCASAEAPPPGPNDAIMERLVLWTLPDPVAALRAWMRVMVPGGRLLVFEGLWAGGSYVQALRRRARGLLHRLQSATREHDADYPAKLVSALPFLADPTPNRIIETIEAAGWRNARLAPERRRIRAHGHATAPQPVTRRNPRIRGRNQPPPTWLGPSTYAVVNDLHPNAHRRFTGLKRPSRRCVRNGGLPVKRADGRGGTVET